MFDVMIIGSGASGLMCRANLDEHLKVLSLEKTNSYAKKMLITGNGRCNITNNKDRENLLKEINYNKKYLYSSIYKFGPEEIMNFFKLDFKEEIDNRIFPVSDNSKDVLDDLICRRKFPINLNEYATSINKVNEYYEIITNKQKYFSKIVVIATGGCSFPHLGSTGDHLKFAENLKEKVIKPFPAETSIILNEKTNLAGTQFNRVCIKYNKMDSLGNLIYTHNGLSGESIMKISEHIYLGSDNEINIDFLPDKSREDLLAEILEKRDDLLYTFLKVYFSKKFSLYLINLLGLSKEIIIKQIYDKKITELINLIKNIKYTNIKVNDLKNAYVTGGGIDLKGINTNSFESKLNKNLYFIGESLDIHGPIGGYNLTLAFSTGYSCAYDINKKNF